MNGGPSGFHNAPVTRSFVVGSAVLTVVSGMLGIHSSLGLSYEVMFMDFHLWTLLSSIFAFSSTPELVFGLSLLYIFRVFERQIGSNKYSVFISFSIVISSLLEILALALIRDPTLNKLASGPYGLIFSSFIPFFFDIPISSRIRIFGVQLSDKSFIYLAGFQLLVSSWKRSLMPGACGVLAGFLYHSNVLGIRHAKFPESVASFVSRLSWPSSGGSLYTLLNVNSTEDASSYGLRHLDASISAPQANYPATAPVMEPPQDSVTMLVSMGFDTSSARQALMHAGNDVTLATNILLEAQSH